MIHIDQLIRTKRKTISLQIKADGSLVVRVPLRVDMKKVENFIKEKNKWIITKQFELKQRFHERQEILRNKQEQGERLFLGEKIFLDLKEEKLILWYKKAALKYFCQRVDFFTQKFALKYNCVKVNSAKSRWGSCSARGNINFSWRLIMAPPEVVDYVVAHEVAHLKHKNHSQKFWAFVEALMPGHAAQRLWLKKNGFTLDG